MTSHPSHPSHPNHQPSSNSPSADSKATPPPGRFPRLLRLAVWLAAGLVLIGAGLVAALQTPRLHEKAMRLLRDGICRAVRENTHAECRLERLSGNLLTGFAVEGLSLMDAATGQPLLIADRAAVGYALPLLLKKCLWITRLELSGLQVYITQAADGRWNLDALAPKDTDPAPSSLSPGWIAGFQTRVRGLSVKNAGVTLVTREEEGAASRRLTGIDCVAAMDIDLGPPFKLTADLKHLAAAMNRPDITLTDVSGALQFDSENNRFSFKDLRVAGVRSDVTINGSLSLLEQDPDQTVSDTLVMDVAARVQPLCLGELGRAFPIVMRDEELVYGDLSVMGPLSRMDCGVNLSMDRLHVESRGIVSIHPEDGVGLDIGGRIAHLDLASLPALYLEHLPGDLSTDKFTLKWLYVGEPRQEGRIELHLTPSTLCGYDVTDAVIAAQIKGPDMRFSPLRLKTPLGELKGELAYLGMMSGSMEKTLAIDADVRRLHLDRVLKREGIASDINGHLAVNLFFPPDYDVENLRSESKIRLEPSKILRDMVIQGADAKAAFKDQTLTIDGCRVAIAGGTAEAEGEVRFRDRRFQLKGKANVPDLGRIGAVLPGIPKDAGLSGGFVLGAQAGGDFDAFEISADIAARSAAWRGNLVESLKADGRFKGNARLFTASLNLDGEGLVAGNSRYTSCNAVLAANPSRLAGKVTVEGEENLRMYVNGEVEDWLKPLKKINISDVSLSAFNQPPVETQGPVRLSLSGDTLTAEACRLVSGPATLDVSGRFGLSPGASNAGRVVLANFHLSRLSQWWPSAKHVQGAVSSEMTVAGTMNAPCLQMSASLSGPALDRMAISPLSAAVFYNQGRADITASAARGGSPLVEAKGEAALALSFIPFAFNLQPDGLRLNLTADKADISWISEMMNHPEYGVKGRLSAGASVTGDVADLRLDGWMRLEEGSLNLKKQGLLYETLKGEARFNGDGIRIETLVMEGKEEGMFQLSGTLVHDRFAIRSVDLKAGGKNLFVPFHKGVRAWVDPALTLTGGLDAPTLGGSIKVVRGRIDLDGLRKTQPSEIKITKPASASNGVLEIPDAPVEGLGLLDPLTADIRLQIVKDCWMKGKDEQIEIGGRVQLQKDAEKPFVLFGALNAVRGTYRFRGKLFQITEGEITFVGQEELNPPVHITAQTEVDDVTIIIRISGYLDRLNLAFESDPPMDQSEIISYVLFGRSMENLSDEESFKAEETALSFTGQIAADKLRDIIGDALGIDYLNISAGTSGLQQGSLTMGKYVMPKVFVVFHQGFSDKKYQQLEVSYEINRHFDLQSQIDNEQTSALDLIWKYEF